MLLQERDEFLDEAVAVPDAVDRRYAGVLGHVRSWLLSSPVAGCALPRRRGPSRGAPPAASGDTPPACAPRRRSGSMPDRRATPRTPCCRERPAPDGYTPRPAYSRDR